MYQLSLSWVSLSRLYIHSRISYSVKAKIPKCIFRILAGRPEKWVWQEPGLWTAWFSLFLSSKEASATGWLLVLLWGICPWEMRGSTAQRETHWNWAPETTQTSVSYLGLWVYQLYVTVNSETQNLLDVWIFPISQNSKIPRNPCHAQLGVPLGVRYIFETDFFGNCSFQRT